MSKEEFETLVEAEPKHHDKNLGVPRRINWVEFREGVSGAARTIDELADMTVNYTTNGQPMSRLRVRGWVLGLMKKGKAFRKLIPTGAHVYFVEPMDKLEIDTANAAMEKKATKATVDAGKDDDEEEEEDTEPEDDGSEEEESGDPENKPPEDPEEIDKPSPITA